jgi:hypothetical protein
MSVKKKVVYKKEGGKVVKVEVPEEKPEEVREVEKKEEKREEQVQQAQGAQEEIVLEVKPTAIQPPILGTFKARLVKIERMPTRLGEALRWHFELLEGPYKGNIVTGLTSMKTGPRAKAFVWFATLGGKIEGGKMKLNSVIGKECKVDVQPRQGRFGGVTFNNVVNVYPP